MEVHPVLASYVYPSGYTTLFAPVTVTLKYRRKWRWG